jgi:molecular chaperone DnaJ
MGRGTVPDVPCGSCGGTGAIRDQRRLEVTIPAGIESGTRLRLAGQGEEEAGGGARGDLIVVVQVRPHRFFRRDGLDIHVTLPLNLAQAVLGSTVRVRTVSGRRVVLRIPPGTQPGTRFRIRGQGIERGGRTGDQFVEVRLTLPESLPGDAEAAFRSFAEKAGLSH